MAAVGLIVFASGCLSFEKRWKESAHYMTPPGSIAGRWHGNWTSEEHNRQGGLRCIITQLRGGDYEARFCTMFAWIIPWECTVGISGKTEGGLLHFSGKQNLGFLWGGIHNYEGKAGPDRFFATYTSGSDEGSVEMTRAD